MNTILIKNTANRLNSDVFTHVSTESKKLFKGKSYGDCLKKVLKMQSYDKDGIIFYARSIGSSTCTWKQVPLVMVYQHFGKNKEAVAKEQGFKDETKMTWEVFSKIDPMLIDEKEDGSFVYVHQEKLNDFVDLIPGS